MTSTCSPIISTQFSFDAFQYRTYMSLFNPDHGDNTFLQNLSTYQNTQHTAPTPNNKKTHTTQFKPVFTVVSSVCSVLQQCNRLHVNTGQAKQKGHKVVRFFLQRISPNVYELKTNRHTQPRCYSRMTSDGTVTICFNCVVQANRGFIVTLITVDVWENNTEQTELETNFK
jgi:hypothetical protein